MAAAADLFRERGFRATSLDDIGAAAGVSGPAIYRYFTSKRELLSVLIEEAADHLARDRRQRPQRGHAAAGHPRAADRRRHRACSCENGNLRDVFVKEYRSLDDDARRRVARIERVRDGRVGAPAVRGAARASPTRRPRAAVIMVDGMLRSVAVADTSIDQDRLAAGDEGHGARRPALGAAARVPSPRSRRDGRRTDPCARRGGIPRRGRVAFLRGTLPRKGERRRAKSGASPEASG